MPAAISYHQQDYSLEVLLRTHYGLSKSGIYTFLLSRTFMLVHEHHEVCICTLATIKMNLTVYGQDSRCLM